MQRASLRRGNKTVDDVWKAANQIGRRSIREAVTQRGERGVRIADLNYRKAGLELGMLKGNQFVITLRLAQSCSTQSPCIPNTGLYQESASRFNGYA